MLLLNSTRCLAGSDTIRLQFETGAATLTETAMRTVDSLVYYQWLLPGQAVAIVGYADRIGSKRANQELSLLRAEAVKAYLAEFGFRPEDVKAVVGKGEIRRRRHDEEAFAEDRRVDIVVFRNSPKPAEEEPAQPDIATAKPNETIRLDNIYFLPGRALARKESYPVIRELAKVLKENTHLKIRVEGHVCCNTGYDAELLSVARAKYVRNFLIKEGIDSNRVAYQGFGRTRPLIHPERTPEDERANRRVEIRILAN